MRKIFLFVSMLATCSYATAQEALPQDPDVVVGKLKNGMTYYIRHNAKEAGLADFYIAQRVGSILEEPRQRGLAHFLEHMAFNGTKNFPGKGKRLGIVPWCESIGVKFGANLNAYTSVDQTVYHIGSAPLKREGIIDSCLLVLHDWSHYLLLEDNEIDKERGVIHEEWRTRRAGKAMQRLMENAMPYLYKGSKYEDCLPIGSMDIVDNFAYQDLRDYYHKWYRPDLQGIIVVGDIDTRKVEKKIKKIFGSIPMPKNAAERVYFPVPDNDSMMVHIERDREQPMVIAHLYMKRDATPDAEKNTVDYFRSNYIDGLIGVMMNSRLNEMRQDKNTPFLSATGRASQFFVSRTKEAFTMSISCRQDDVLGSIISGVAAAERVRQHGFTQPELDRAKKLQLAAAERHWNNRDDRRNSTLVNLCVQHFLAAEPMLSADARYELMKRMNNEVTLSEVNEGVKQLITDRNQVMLVYAPDQPELVLPSEHDIERVVSATQHLSYSPYMEENLDNMSLIANEPKAGTIVSEKPFKHGFTLLKLSNGMEVYVKPTTFQADEVQMSIKGEGGTSLYGDEDIPQFALLSSAVVEGGVGQFDAIKLRKRLTGHMVRLQPFINSQAQGINGTSSVKDLETMLQMSYLYFTQPRRDDKAFEGLLSRTRSFLTNRNASPKVDYNDSINATLFGHHPRVAPTTKERLDQANYDRILEIYRERFADASNFKVTIIGNVSLEQLRPMLCKYLASLPATNKHERANRANVPEVVAGNFTKQFRKKMATPLANVSIYYTAKVPFTAKNDLVLDFLKRCLSIAYTDSVREEKGGTYGVSVGFELEREDEYGALLRIAYNADPDRYEELNPIIYRQLENIAENGPLKSSMDKVRKYLIKQYAQFAITNDYWNYILRHEIEDNEDFDRDYCLMCEQITADDVKQMARELLRQGRRIEVTMLSE